MHNIFSKLQHCYLLFSAYTDELFRSVNDVLAADLPQDVKKDLKLLAHEIAGALVFELCMYAIRFSFLYV